MMFMKPTPTLDHHLNMQTSLALHTAWPLLLLFVAQSHALPLCDFFFLPYLFYPCRPSQLVLSRTQRHTTRYPTHNESLINKCVSPLFPESVRTGKAIWKALQSKLCRFKNSFGHMRQQEVGKQVGGEWSGSGGLNLTHEYLWVDT